MVWIDYVLLVILAYFIFKGARRGFIATVGAFVGIILGAWAAGRYYDVLAEKLIEYWDVSIMVAIVISFVAIYLAINIVVVIAVRILMLIFSFVPFGKTTNQLVGALLGLAEGLLMIGLIIWIINLFPFDNSFTNSLNESKVASYFEYSTRVVRPLLPSDLREVDFTALRDLGNLTEEKAQYLQQYMPTFFDRIQEQRDRMQQKMDDKIESAEQEP